MSLEGKFLLSLFRAQEKQEPFCAGVSGYGGYFHSFMPSTLQVFKWEQADKREPHPILDGRIPEIVAGRAKKW